MAYDCRVYQILIASPSDVEEEREIAVRVIQEWNDLYSYSRKVALLPLRWETHTAPEYGTRPQEVINRAIVDQCDLLVGIFWTRIGSPTGEAESGTLEEIDRVGKAEKPVMLYFSKVGIDPDRIDLSQIEKLKDFKEQTYPKGLIESYKTIIEFRDKFAKQLELKVREMQQGEATGELPLLLQFLSIEKSELVGSHVESKIVHPQALDINIVPEKKRDELKPIIAEHIKRLSYVPVPLAIENSTSSGIRNLYIELKISASSESLEVTDSIGSGMQWITTNVASRGWISKTGTITTPIYTTHERDWYPKSAIAQEVESKLSRFDADKLQRSDQGWRLSFEWEAIQPQRIRLIKPVLYVYAPESTDLWIKAKIFSDSFTEPFILGAEMKIEVEQKNISLKELIPNLEAFIENAEE